jgi:hypothetical protein
VPEARVIPLDGGRSEASPRRRKADKTAPAGDAVLDPTPPAPEASDLERKLAGALAFVRRRITGDYPIDDFGFDADLTDSVILPALRPI